MWRSVPSCKSTPDVQNLPSLERVAPSHSYASPEGLSRTLQGVPGLQSIMVTVPCSLPRPMWSKELQVGSLTVLYTGSLHGDLFPLTLASCGLGDASKTCLPTFPGFTFTGVSLSQSGTFLLSEGRTQTTLTSPPTGH